MQKAPISSVEQSNNVERLARESRDRSRHFMAMQRAGFVERYVQADANLAIRYRGVGPRHYGFVVEAQVAAKGDWTGKGKADAARENERVQHSAVFPGQVESMEGAKQVIPSRIRAAIFDDRAFIDIAKPLYLFEDMAFGLGKIAGCIGHRKVGTSGFWEPVSGGESTSKDIKAAPYAVYDNPCLGVNERIERFDIGQAVNLFSGLRIGIDARGVGVVSLPLDDPFDQNWELGYGPIDSGLSIE